MNEVSNLFVCLMGMGTTFVGLICIIFLTMLMGKVMQKSTQKFFPLNKTMTWLLNGRTDRILSSSMSFRIASGRFNFVTA